MLWAGNYFAERSYCDLDLQGSDPNLVHDMLSNHGDHLYDFFNRTSNNKVMGRTRLY